MKNYESLVEAWNDLKERGYTADFATDNVCLYCGELDIRLHPEDFQVDEMYQFEEETHPDNNVLLYAITSSTGVKGTLADANGVYAGHLELAAAAKLRQHQASPVSSNNSKALPASRGILK